MDQTGEPGTTDNGGRRTRTHPGEILAQALAGSRPTVTEFLELVVGEAIYADKIFESEITATIDNSLGVRPGHPLLQRASVLRGRMSERSYVYAETSLVAQRLPPKALRHLIETNEPIGRVLVDQELAVERKYFVPNGASSRRPQAGIATDAFYARQYRIDIDGLPVMQIAEWFLPDLVDFLVD